MLFFGSSKCRHPIWYFATKIRSSKSLHSKNQDLVLADFTLNLVFQKGETHADRNYLSESCIRTRASVGIQSANFALNPIWIKVTRFCSIEAFCQAFSLVNYNLLGDEWINSIDLLSSLIAMNPSSTNMVVWALALILKYIMERLKAQ